jgi:hypothetical protein
VSKEMCLAEFVYFYLFKTNRTERRFCISGMGGDLGKRGESCNVGKESQTDKQIHEVEPLESYCRNRSVTVI